MKRLNQLLLIVAIYSLTIFAGCKIENSQDPGVGSFTTLTNYLAANNMDLPDILDGWIIPAPAPDDVATFVSTYHIIDLREATDFDNGHIEGAVNSTLPGILTAANGVTKPILVVCYTGQAASHGVVALRLSGHPDAKVLKWGMSGWNSTFSAKWNDNIGDAAVGNSNWENAPGALRPVINNSFPNLSTSATEGAAILAERVSAMINGGFKGIVNTDVLTTPANYYINNYWALADVQTYGNIKEATRVNPLAILNLSDLDPNKTVVTYCWTGQTSSMVTAYLTVLGYNAKSLKFGANGMIYSVLAAHKFVTPTNDLPVVP